jgi:hypothetical protein
MEHESQKSRFGNQTAPIAVILKGNRIKKNWRWLEKVHVAHGYRKHTYVCFKLFHDIGAGQAHFIIRATSNLVYDSYETLPVEMPEQWATFFTGVADRKIRFTNDSHQHD